MSGILSFAVDDQENIYILDTKPLRIKVFNSESELLRSFGQAGQWPGDLPVTGSIKINRRNEILCVDEIKGELKMFSTDGRFLRSSRCPSLRWSRHTTLMSSDRIYSIGLAPGSSEEKLISLVLPYEEPVVTASRPTPSQAPIPLIWIRYASMPDNHLIWGITSRYEIYVIDERLSPHFPAFDFIFTDGAGRLFVKTFEMDKKTDNYLIDIFEIEGRFLARASLKDGYVVKGNLHSGGQERIARSSLSKASICFLQVNFLEKLRNFLVIEI
ncbi:MAG: hypothetical protein ACE5LC_10725 [Candidatus Aminicenantales bacterium]